MNKAYALYKRHELNEKSKKTGKTLGKHVINLYFTGISRLLKIKDVKNYAKILKMIRSSKIKWLAWVAFLCTFGNFLVPVLIAARTANNVDFSDETEDESYESEP